MTVKKSSDLLRPPEDRAAHYKVVAEGNIARSKELFEVGKTTQSDAILISIDGGKCYKCGEEYEAVEVDNIFAKFTYYRPRCSCYPICWHCGRLLVEEKIERDNLKYCSNCHVNIYETDHHLPTAVSQDRENLLAKQKKIQRHKDYEGQRRSR